MSKEQGWITIQATTDPNETSYLELGSSANDSNTIDSDPDFHTTTKMGNGEASGNNDIESTFPIWSLDMTQFEARNKLETDYQLNSEPNNQTQTNKKALEQRYQETRTANQTSNKPANAVVPFLKAKIEPNVQDNTDLNTDFWNQYLQVVPLDNKGNISMPNVNLETQPKTSKISENLIILREKTLSSTQKIAQKLAQKSKNFISKTVHKVGEKITEYGEKYGENLNLDGNNYGRDPNPTQNNQPKHQEKNQNQPNLLEKFSSRLQNLRQSTTSWWKK